MSEQPEQLKIILAENVSETKKKPAKKTAAAKAKQVEANSSLLPQSETPSAAISKTSDSINTTKSTNTTEPTNGATTMPETNTKSKDFESMLAELEKVVGQLEGELKLEEALALFERGLGLSQECEKFLQAAQQRIEILKRSSNGEMTSEPFAEELELT